MSASLLNRGRIKQAFAQAIEASPLSAVVSQIANEITSDVRDERYSVPFATPRFAERFSPKTAELLGAYTFDVKNKLYDAAVAIEDLDAFFDQTNVWNTTIASLAESAALLKWELLVNEMNNGNGAGYLSYDGQYFYDTDHSIGASGTQVNNVTNSHVPVLDVSSTSNVTPEEMASILSKLAAYMMGYKDDKGRPTNRGLRKFVAVLPTAMFGSGLTAVYANNLARGQTNVIPAIRAGGYEFDVVIEPDLSSSTVGYLHAVVPTRKPFILQTARDFNPHILDESSEHYAKTGEMLARADWVGRAGRGEFLRSMRFTVS